MDNGIFLDKVLYTRTLYIRFIDILDWISGLNQTKWPFYPYIPKTYWLLNLPSQISQLVWYNFRIIDQIKGDNGYSTKEWGTTEAEQNAGVTSKG